MAGALIGARIRLTQQDGALSPQALGIDGCRGGWVWIGNQDERWCGGVVGRLEQLRPLLAEARLTLIDMPIGLLDGGRSERPCDREARALLGRPRASSVFRPPCRATLAVADQGYSRACEVNREATGVALSQQTFNILPKMQEVDALLQHHPGLREQVRESHPEVCLWWLNGRQPMRFNKRASAGERERRQVLRTHSRQLEATVDRMMTEYLRRELALDDAIDAAVLAFAARRILQCGTAGSLPRQAPTDSLGLPMAILLPPG
ncbi:hypothetical protein CKO40_13985 [Halochromatium glycolicum]|uniref:DUF429 domain-containing protein n=1 Tax=Halochromatium glycolicum TaxID=85075 RepID=A0AAJ0XAZ7_9GAMM|nr:hypothetical protein [Halochromatium glycolicum]